MGGMAGFGPVDVSADASGHEWWEARIQATALLSGGMSRPGIEAIPPAEYLSSGYAEKWLVCAEQRLIGDGVVDPDRLDHWRSEFAADPTRMPPRDDAPERVAGLVEMLTTTPLLSDAPSPRFAVGDRVRVRRMRPEGHHRCPRYVPRSRRRRRASAGGGASPAVGARRGRWTVRGHLHGAVRLVGVVG